MSAFAKQQNSAHYRHFVSPARPDHANSRHAPACDPFHTQQLVWGNQAMQRLLRTSVIQAKLIVNQPGDPHEREADRVAEQVMRIPEPRLQRHAAPEEELLRTKPFMQRQAKLKGKAEALIQTKPLPQRRVNDGMGAHSETPAVVSEMPHSSGRSLDPATCAFMESRFGHNFSQVRIHTDAKAGEAARMVNARAYTVGQNIVFGIGQYEPDSASGRRLLAHELAHVIQQRLGATVDNASLSTANLGGAIYRSGQVADWTSDHAMLRLPPVSDVPQAP